MALSEQQANELAELRERLDRVEDEVEVLRPPEIDPLEAGHLAFVAQVQARKRGKA